MKIEHYLNELLHQKEAVILPGFGEFKTIAIPTTTDASGNLTPPAKTLSLNTGIKANDYNLARYVAEKENLSITQGNELLKNYVHELLSTLSQQNTVVIPQIGTVTAEADNKLSFVQADGLNFDTASFGLSPVSTFEHTVDNEIHPKKITSDKKRRKLPWWIWLILLLVALTVAGFLNKDLVITYYQKAISTILPDQKPPSEDETTVIPDNTTPSPEAGDSTEVPSDEIYNTLTADTLPLAKTPDKQEPEQSISYGSWHIIAGCFGSDANANRMVTRLHEQGFGHASIKGQTPSGLFRVSAGAFPSREEAQQKLNNAQSENKLDNAWVAKL